MLDIVPISLKEANEFVVQHHRHHGKTTGHKFSIAVADTETQEIVGVAIVGRPVSRYLDDGWTLEVNRLCTNGTKKRLLHALCGSMESSPRDGVQKTDNLRPGK